eukprot:scaffold60785_cov36-Phaeocystis_antarctica.AAC.1
MPSFSALFEASFLIFRDEPHNHSLNASAPDGADAADTGADAGADADGALSLAGRRLGALRGAIYVPPHRAAPQAGVVGRLHDGPPCLPGGAAHPHRCARLRPLVVSPPRALPRVSAPRLVEGAPRAPCAAHPARAAAACALHRHSGLRSRVAHAPAAAGRGGVRGRRAVPRPGVPGHHAAAFPHHDASALGAALRLLRRRRHRDDAPPPFAALLAGRAHPLRLRGHRRPRGHLSDDDPLRATTPECRRDIVPRALHIIHPHRKAAALGRLDAFRH